MPLTWSYMQSKHSINSNTFQCLCRIYPVSLLGEVRSTRADSHGINSKWPLVEVFIQHDNLVWCIKYLCLISLFFADLWSFVVVYLWELPAAVQNRSSKRKRGRYLIWKLVLFHTQERERGHPHIFGKVDVDPDETHFSVFYLSWSSH